MPRKKAAKEKPAKQKSFEQTLWDTADKLRGSVGSSKYKHFVVDFAKRDRYGRILGKVLLDGEDMNLEQVRAGLAWHYKKYQKQQSPEDREMYSDAEIEARKASRGLWYDPAPVPPWEYRRRK